MWFYERRRCSATSSALLFVTTIFPRSPSPFAEHGLPLRIRCPDCIHTGPQMPYPIVDRAYSRAGAPPGQIAGGCAVTLPARRLAALRKGPIARR